MKLQALIESKLFLKLAESREDDMDKLHIANEAFENIEAFVRKLGKDPSKFAEKFYTDNDGRFIGFHMETNLSKKQQIPEISDLYIEFLDHELSNVKPTIKARADRNIEPNTGKLTQLRIKLYIDAPQAANKSVKAYNKWFVNNLADLLESSNYRSSFVHEFTHTLDFRRINPEYLVARAKRKISEKEAGKVRDRDKYANDPLELNAYYQQAMSELYNDLLKTETTDEWNANVGETAQEFVDKLLTIYLRPQVQKRLTPENKKRLMKRAATAWEYLKLN